MSEIIETLNAGLKSVETKLETELKSAIEKYEGQLQVAGSASNEAKAEVKALSEKFDATITELAQKMEGMKPQAAPVIETAGAEFVKSEQFRQLVSGDRQNARLELKNTVTSGSTTVFPAQNQGIISGDFKPLTIRQLLRAVPVSSNAVYSLREASWTNNAAEVSQGRAKYALWAKGYMPDAVIVNPADWGAAELLREQYSAGNLGMYLAGAPGSASMANPFGVRIVLSNNMTAGKFAIGAFDQSAVVYNRQGAVVEMGYVNSDFTNNVVTIRAEERLALAVEKPSAIYYGDFSA